MKLRKIWCKRGILQRERKCGKRQGLPSPEQHTELHYWKTGGFTLVELIVVLAIITLLAGILMPSYLGYIDRAKQRQRVIEGRQLRLAVSTLFVERMAQEGRESAMELSYDIYWVDIGDEDHPLYGFCPSNWEAGGVITGMVINDAGELTEITYQGPDGSEERWTLMQEDGNLSVEVMEQ